MITDVLLLDDEQASLDYSRQVLTHFVPENKIHCAQTVEEAMTVLKSTSIMLAFLDVELTHSSGFALCDYIHRQYPEAAVVFLTGHTELGVQSFDYEPFDFLTKPVDVLRVEKTFHRFEQRYAQNTAPRLMIETSAGFAMVNPVEICYIVKDRGVCQMYCQNGEKYRVTDTLDKLEGTLMPYYFFRTHQSYLVPALRIVNVQATKFGTSYEARLNDGSIVPVSRSKYAKLKKYMLKTNMRML